MASFYEKLSTKLQKEDAAATAKGAASVAARGVSYNAAGAKTADPPKGDPPGDPAGAPDSAPEGTDSLTVDLFQSDTRMVVFVQAGGVFPEDFDVTADEESNTLLIQAKQKRPDVPPPHGAQPGAEPEKGRFVKQEIKWDPLYRKVYLPAPFDGGEAETFLQHGVLIVVLPIKKLGEGKKLPVRESKNEAPKV
ncbi:MAG: Hsp20/alpha crystallin family protein [Minisyncoccia bacterium]|jgi:HSP20 family molecular chaperone IbpA